MNQDSSQTKPVPQPGETKVLEGQPPERIKKIRRFVVIVIAFLLVIGLAELGYLLLGRQGKNIISTEPGGAPAIPFKIKTPSTPTPTPAKSKILNTDVLNDILTSFTDLRDKGKTSYLDQFSVTYTTKGSFVSGTYEEKEISGIKYVYIMTLDNGSGKELTIRFSAEEMQNMDIWLTTDLGEKEIGLSEIVLGDTVIIKQTYNLLDTSPYPKIELDVSR